MFIFFFFNDTATTEIYTLSLHDALPISFPRRGDPPPATGHIGATRETPRPRLRGRACDRTADALVQDRKSTRLNSSHLVISYAVFCLKKNNTNTSPS